MKLTLIVLLLLNMNMAFAGITDTCRNDEDIVVDQPVYICANIAFPDILCGEEEKAIDYIANFSTNRRDYLIKMYNKSRKYHPKVVTELKRYGVPEEFWVLMALESAFNGNAVSKAGAVGFWQFMAPVAREYGLKTGGYSASKTKSRKGVKPRPATDERKNFYKSTVAAARYLKDRSINLNNDCLLMAASYNCGIGNVWNAMKRTKKESPDFWDIKKYLPRETQSYVMNFIALSVIYNNYEQFLNKELVFRDIIITPEEKKPEVKEVSLAGL